MENSTCENCRYWYQPSAARNTEPVTKLTPGICRRYPPSPVARHKLDVPEGGSSRFSVNGVTRSDARLVSAVDSAWSCTTAGQWCGEHQPACASPICAACNRQTARDTLRDGTPVCALCALRLTPLEGAVHPLMPLECSHGKELSQRCEECRGAVGEGNRVVDDSEEL